MTKHSRKRQKLHNDDKRDKKNNRREKAQRVPLGTPRLVDTETEKDDEERRLESMLFGTKFVSTDVSGMEFMVSDDEGVGERLHGQEEGAGQLQHLSDSDVRVFSVTSGRKDVRLFLYSYSLWTTVLQRRYLISNQILKRATKRKEIVNKDSQVQKTKARPLLDEKRNKKLHR